MKSFVEFLREMKEFPVEETPSQKKIRIHRGYTKIIRIDAAKFQKQFEADRNEKLDWNERRLSALKDLNSIDSYPQVHLDWAEKVDVLDGRHRIANAAAKGMSIKIAVPKNKQGNIPTDLIV